MLLLANPKPEIFKIKLDDHVNSQVVSVSEPYEKVVEFFFNYSRSNLVHLRDFFFQDNNWVVKLRFNLQNSSAHAFRGKEVTFTALNTAGSKNITFQIGKKRLEINTLNWFSTQLIFQVRPKSIPLRLLL